MVLLNTEKRKRKMNLNEKIANVAVIKRKDRYMKKSMIAVAVIIIVGTSGLAIAQMDKDKEMMGDKAEMMDGKGGMMGMMGKGMMNGKMMGMCPMMKSMMDKNVVATSDGGIVVVAGNKLTKYDKDLNVVKEVELKMDMEGMQKMMDNMKSMCPMMDKGMMGGMDKQSDKAQDTTPTASGEVDHASHH